MFPHGIVPSPTLRPRQQVQIYYSGKSRYIGVFDTKLEATISYELAREIADKFRTIEGADSRREEVAKQIVELMRHAAFGGCGRLGGRPSVRPAGWGSKSAARAAAKATGGEPPASRKGEAPKERPAAKREPEPAPTAKAPTGRAAPRAALKAAPKAAPRAVQPPARAPAQPTTPSRKANRRVLTPSRKARDSALLSSPTAVTAEADGDTDDEAPPHDEDDDESSGPEAAKAAPSPRRGRGARKRRQADDDGDDEYTPPTPTRRRPRRPSERAGGGAKRTGGGAGTSSPSRSRKRARTDSSSTASSSLPNAPGSLPTVPYPKDGEEETFVLHDGRDVDSINELHTIVRRDIWEGFVVAEGAGPNPPKSRDRPSGSRDTADGGGPSRSGVDSRANGRLACYEGTVGFRCRWCKDVEPGRRAEKSAVYPRELKRIYHANIRFQRDHIP